LRPRDRRPDHGSKDGLRRPLDAGADEWIADAAFDDEVDGTAHRRRKRVAQREEFSEGGACSRFERNEKVDVRSLGFEIRQTRRGAEEGQTADAEAAADLRDLRAAFGD
jgi:hypothetical protein